MLDTSHTAFLIYGVAHVTLPRVTLKRTSWVEIEPLGEAALNAAIIEVDGESPGRIPARFEVMPGVLTLRA